MERGERGMRSVGHRGAESGEEKVGRRRRREHGQAGEGRRRMRGVAWAGEGGASENESVAHVALSQPSSLPFSIPIHPTPHYSTPLHRSPPSDDADGAVREGQHPRAPRLLRQLSVRIGALRAREEAAGLAPLLLHSPVAPRARHHQSRSLNRQLHKRALSPRHQLLTPLQPSPRSQRLTPLQLPPRRQRFSGLKWPREEELKPQVSSSRPAQLASRRDGKGGGGSSGVARLPVLGD